MKCRYKKKNPKTLTTTIPNSSNKIKSKTRVKKTNPAAPAANTLTILKLKTIIQINMILNKIKTMKMKKMIILFRAIVR